MVDNNGDNKPSVLTISSNKLGVRDSVNRAKMAGAGKTVMVEVKKKRVPGAPSTQTTLIQPASSSARREPTAGAAAELASLGNMRLTPEERAARLRALQAHSTNVGAAEKRPELPSISLLREAANEPRQPSADMPRVLDRPPSAAIVPPEMASPSPTRPQVASDVARRKDLDEDEDDRASSAKKPDSKKGGYAVVQRYEERRKAGKVNVTALLSEDGAVKTRSMAAVRRAREKERLKMLQSGQQAKIIREVIIPEYITVQELANRMSERAGDVVKALMRNGVMATINETIDADVAELVVIEFGHTPKRVSESDVEQGLGQSIDAPEDLLPRPPVVTIMGHVDHGKTSLLDALRATDVVAGEAGGITQHIGAYQICLANNKRITFIDTPGHAAFTEMRARGANVTDIVVLVVAADEGIKEQTVEALNHAKAAKVPIIVAINKIDKPGSDPTRVRTELLNHDLVTEAMGGDVLSVEVSAKSRLNLDKLEEAILLQAEILELKANPNRLASGAVVESKVEKGLGSVATVLVQQGTLRPGDIFVSGAEWGRVRALIDDKGKRIPQAVPALPVEVLGFTGTPQAGDDFVVVADETKAREVAAYRQRSRREAMLKVSRPGNIEQMLSKITAGEVKELCVIIKGDVHGSVEAISTSLGKLQAKDVSLKVIHAAVGGISESDVVLANASKAIILGFNVRANPQARDMARRDGVEIRYHSIIYNLLEEIRTALTGLLPTEMAEEFLGYAEVREVFNITKVGRVAGCYVTEGVIRRNTRVRLLRDNVVIHTGALKALKRFKDEVKEVKQGFECGISLENFNDIQPRDVIECFDMKEVERKLEL
ncbi:MAG: translation initiation factor IF-2, partial [Alphaproteobacteria bacterium]|nr:translation initiation factor IF-2 [Alphaproteobacteria bacterium]